MSADKTRRVLHNRIAQRRKELGITQKELGIATNYTRQYVLAIEKGKQNPSVRIALEFARVLNCSVDHLFFLEDESLTTLDSPLNKEWVPPSRREN